VPKLQCPHCGNTDLSQMEFMEDVISTREILGFNAEGVLHFSPVSEEHVDFGDQQRIHCKACSEHFPIPDVRIDYTEIKGSLRVCGAGDEWIGSLEDLMAQRDDLPEHTARRIEGLKRGEKIVLDFDDTFTVERLA